MNINSPARVRTGLDQPWTGAGPAFLPRLVQGNYFKNRMLGSIGPTGPTFSHTHMRLRKLQREGDIAYHGTINFTRLVHYVKKTINNKHLILFLGWSWVGPRLVLGWSGLVQ